MDVPAIKKESLMKTLQLCLLSLVTAFLPGASAIAVAEGAASPQPKLVYTLQEGETIADDRGMPIIGAYGKDQAYVGIKKDDKSFLVSGAGRAGPYSALSACFTPWTPLPSGAGFAYFARKAEGGSFFVVNGKEYGPYRNESNSCELGKAGFSFTALKDDGKWYANFNGKELGPFDKEPAIALGEGGYSLVAKKPDGTCSVSVNGAEYGPYKSASVPVVAKAGFIFTAQKPDGAWYAIVNGKERGPYKYYAGEASLDSAGFGYGVIKADQKAYALIYGKEYGPFEGEVTDMRLGKGGYAFSVRKGDTVSLQVNGKQYGPFEYAYPLSPTKAGYAYEIYRDAYVFVANGKEFPCFSGDCQSLWAGFYDTGAWYFSQIFDRNDPKSLYGIRFSDGTIVKDSIAGSQALDADGKNLCVWFTRKGEGIYLNSKALR
jgi:hypothetical protein